MGLAYSLKVQTAKTCQNCGLLPEAANPTFYTRHLLTPPESGSGIKGVWAVPLGQPQLSHSASDHRSAILLSSVLDQRSAISDPSAVCRRPLLRHQLSLVPAECKCKSSSAIFSAGSKSPPMQAGSSSPPMHCSCWEPQKLGIGDLRSAISDHRIFVATYVCTARAANLRNLGTG